MSKAAKAMGGEDLEKLSPLAREIAEGLTNAIAFGRGKKCEARITEFELPDPAPIYRSREVREIRQKLGMTQLVFARLMNVSVKSVEGWEAGTKAPGPASRRLLQIAHDGRALATVARAAGYRVVANKAPRISAARPAKSRSSSR